MSKIRIKQQEEPEQPHRPVVRIKRAEDSQPAKRSKADMKPIIFSISCIPSLSACKSAVLKSSSIDIPDDEDDEEISDNDDMSRDVQLFIAQTSRSKQGVRTRAPGDDHRESMPAYIPIIAKVPKNIAASQERQFQLTNLSEMSLPNYHFDSAGSQRFAIKYPPADLPADTPPMVNASVSPDQLAKLIAPSAIPWFRWETISQPERAQLSWMGMNDNSYKSLRDKIMLSYAENPLKYVSPKSLRESLGFSNLPALVRVWSVLDYLGLVNFVADPSSVPRYAKRFIDFGAQSNIKDVRDCTICKRSCGYSGYVMKETTQVSAKLADSCLWCAKCFASAKYPTGFTEENFERVDLSVLPQTAEWTEEQTILLLEGLERYGETDWTSIASHVGGKTAHQCLVHFVSLPIEDRFTAPLELRGKSDNPFSDVDNPLLATLSFLSSSVHPVIASAAAKAAFQSIANSDAMKISQPEYHEEILEHSLEAAARQAVTLGQVERNGVISIFPKLLELQIKRVEQKLLRLNRILPQSPQHPARV